MLQQVTGCGGNEKDMGGIEGDTLFCFIYFDSLSFVGYRAI